MVAVCSQINAVVRLEQEQPLRIAGFARQPDSVRTALTIPITYY